MMYKPQIVKAYFEQQGLPSPVFEYKHIPNRQFRLDVAWPDYKIGVEVQGNIWKKGAHSTGKGIKRDMEKGNLSLVNGWFVILVTPDDLCMAETVQMLRALFSMKKDLK